MNRRQFLASTTAGILTAPVLLQEAFAQETPFRVKYFRLDAGVGPHDVTPAPDGTVWFTGQRNGTLGRLDPRDGSSRLVNLGKGAAPHGVTIGPDSAAWVTEGGQNAIARVDPADHSVKLFRLPEKYAATNLNTGVFDSSGIYWFTGQSGYYGRLDSRSGDMKVFEAPRGVGPYGITATPKGEVWYASLAGNYIARIDAASGQAAVVDPPTPRQGSRRIWSDSEAVFGSVNGTAATSRCTIPPMAPGKHGSCRARARAPTPSMSTTKTRSGSPIFRPMPSCASIRRRRSSTYSRATSRERTSVNSTGAAARYGAPSPAPIAWS